jgi:hypothetical protein
MIIPGQFGFNCPSGLREEAFWNIFPIGSNVKLSSLYVSFHNIQYTISPLGVSTRMSLINNLIYYDKNSLIKYLSNNLNNNF